MNLPSSRWLLLRCAASLAILTLQAPAHAQAAQPPAMPSPATGQTLPASTAALSPGLTPAPATAAAPQAANAAIAAAHSTEGPSFAPMGLALLAVLALMAAVLWALRRAGLAPRAGGANLLRLVSQLSLGPRERVVIVEAGDRWLLLGVGTGGIARLGSLPKGEYANAQLPVASFGTLLDKLRKGKT